MGVVEIPTPNGALWQNAIDFSRLYKQIQKIPTFRVCRAFVRFDVPCVLMFTHNIPTHACCAHTILACKKVCEYG